MKLLLQAIKSLIRKVENSAERVLSFFGGDGIIKQEHLPDGYPYIGEGEILPSTVAVPASPDWPMAPIYVPIPLSVGNRYTVTLDGSNYECIARRFEEEGTTIAGVPFQGVAIGAVGGLDTGESDYPFAVIAFDQPGKLETGAIMYAGAFLSNVTPQTISISGNKLTKIDPLYLPDPILSSPNGTRYKITVADDGTLSATAINS